jgi:hypothetical protein
MDIDRNRFRAGGDRESGRRANKDWLDWLNNDPPSATARQELRQKRLAEANRYQSRSATPPVEPSQTAGPPNVTININVPKFSLPKIKMPSLPKLPALPYRRLMAVSAILAVLTAGAWWGIDHWRSGPKGTETPAVAGETVRSSPSFTPLAPKDKPQLAQSTAKVTAYDGRHDTYSYVDLLPGGHITVSEQALPTNTGSPDKALATVALRSGADKRFETKSGTAYMRTDPKNGSQIVIFSINSLLLFINSPYGHTTATWKAYIDSF